MGKLMIVGEEVESNEFLHYVYDEVVGVDNAVLRNIKHGIEGKAKASELKENVIKMIGDEEPTCVILIGQSASDLLLKKKKIDSIRGLQHSTTINNRIVPLLPTYSIMKVEKGIKDIGVWARDIEKAFNLSNGIVTKRGTKMVLCDTFEKVKTAVKYCLETKVCSFDFETTKIDNVLGIRYEGFKATTISLSFQAGSGYVIPLEHKNSPYTKEEVFEIMAFIDKCLFSNPKVRKIAHNLNYDYHVASYLFGIDKMRGRIDDTQLMYHLIDETEKRSLEHLVSIYLPSFDGYGREVKTMKWDEVPLDTLATYNATDTDLTLRLCTLFESYLLGDERLYLIYRNLSMAVFRPLWEAEHRGMKVDREYLKQAVDKVEGYIGIQQKKLEDNKVFKRYMAKRREKQKQAQLTKLEEKLEKRIQKSVEMAEKSGKDYATTKTEENLRDKIRDIKTGRLVVSNDFSFKSPKQLMDLFYDSENGFKFSFIEKSTSKDVLNEIQDESGFIDNLLFLRSLEKLQSTYLKAIYAKLDRNDRVHTNFRIDGTVSGRLSSRSPNMQNLPNPYTMKEELAKKSVEYLKDSFIPPEGHTLVQIDYSQAELRVIAEFAGESNMINIYKQDGDIHGLTASRLLGIDYKDFDKSKPEHSEARQDAKSVNFGLIYGMSSEGYKHYAYSNYDIEMTSEEAEKTRSMFFDLYPKLREYHKIYIAKARKFGWVRTLFGRRRLTPDINSSDGFKSSQDERAAINSPIQGTAGEFTIFAIALLFNRLPFKYKFINSIHDSLMFYIPDDYLMEGIKLIANTCENLPTKQYFGVELKEVGMKVDADVSKESWNKLKEINIE